MFNFFVSGIITLGRIISSMLKFLLSFLIYLNKSFAKSIPTISSLFSKITGNLECDEFIIRGKISSIVEFF